MEVSSWNVSFFMFLGRTLFSITSTFTEAPEFYSLAAYATATEFYSKASFVGAANRHSPYLHPVHHHLPPSSHFSFAFRSNPCTVNLNRQIHELFAFSQCPPFHYSQIECLYPTHTLLNVPSGQILDAEPFFLSSRRAQKILSTARSYSNSRQTKYSVSE